MNPAVATRTDGSRGLGSSTYGPCCSRQPGWSPSPTTPSGALGNGRSAFPRTAHAASAHRQSVDDDTCSQPARPDDDFVPITGPAASCVPVREQVHPARGQDASRMQTPSSRPGSAPHRAGPVNLTPAPGSLKYWWCADVAEQADALGSGPSGWITHGGSNPPIRTTSPLSYLLIEQRLSPLRAVPCFCCGHSLSHEPGRVRTHLARLSALSARELAVPDPFQDGKGGHD